MSASSGTSLRTKLLGLSVTTVVALALLFVVTLANDKQQMMTDRQEKIRNLVEVAHATIAHFEKLAREGRMSVDDAKKAAMNAVREMRYDKTEYFWINDFSPTTLMHPVRPELEGKAMNEVKDPTGKVLFVEFVKVVKASGAGYVDYLWPKPGSNAPVPKISYVKGFEPWGWIVGTGIYIDDVDALFRQQATKFLIWGIGIGGFIAFALFIVGRNIVNTLGGDPQYAAEITKRIAAGDLTTDVRCAPGDTTSLLAGMKAMQETLRAMIKEIVAGAERLASASDELLHASEEVAMRSRQQSESASAMAAAVEEMTVSIDQVSHNAGEAHGISQEAGTVSEQGTGIIQNAAVEMRKIADAVQSSSLIIEELGQQSDQITSIVNTIKEIADQTNLLALNAAIEAARAGEQGRGFAVVADEVRKLAERTSMSTTEIAGMVEKIQNGTRNAVASMQTGVTQADKGVALANEAGQSIVSIRDGALRVVDVVNDISSSIREQSAASSDIAKNIERIAQMSEESAQAVQHTTDAARHLQELSAALHASVSRFKAV
ncbi:MAG TPA: methyl-accepting chemotaxis protein [Azospira sp.]|nr:methyl-accepting chemotaxis protein [Azospira sp.]HNN07648.1 methyl-accepting chemotaxis protein [Azospira sp.]HNN44779.1 methyl-accepting chemotaxis protein [Azospira sp.]